VPDTSRIEELQRRVQRDPASIAFAQLAEEYRRAGRYKEAIDTCENGLAHHPGYLSARVTLGRSYLETNELDAAQMELRQVLRAAPENLAALRGLADIHYRRGELQEALAHYRTALEFARNDPELQHLVEQIAQDLEPRGAVPEVVDGLSFQEVQDTFLNLALPDARDAALPGDGETVRLSGDGETAQPSGDGENVQLPGDGDTALSSLTPGEPPAPADEDPFAWPVPAAEAAAPAAPSEPAPPDAAPADDPAAGAEVPGDAGGERQVEALERWLDAIIADRQRQN
jgi:tetratricopeptide (TPR) repeat protein